MRLPVALAGCALLLFFPVLLPGQTQPITAYNTTYYDALNPDPPANDMMRYSALWGYTAPDDREYALLGGYRGTFIIDVTEKPIKQVAFIPGPENGWREIKTFGNYAYVVSEGGAGLQIIDLAGLPNSAELVKSDSSTFRTAHTLTQEGDWLYVNGSNLEANVNGGTLIFNVADNPLEPELVGTYDKHYVHDVTIRNDTMYAAAITDGYLSLVYLGADRKDPQLVTTITYPGAGTHNSDLTTDGRYVMTTDEVGQTEKTLKVWDILDRDDIVQVADWTPQPRAIVHNVRIVESLAFVSWYTAGTRIVDISDPVHPVEIAFFDFLPGEAPLFRGNWDIYPYFKSGKLIASSMEQGLYVFTLDVERKGVVSGTVRDAESGDPLPGATVILTELGRSVTADAQGRYEVAAGEGTLAFDATAVNYLLFEDGELTLTSTGVEQDILMTPLELREVRVIAADAQTQEEISGFSYEVLTRGSGKSEEPVALSLPTDSSYIINVGKWGYHTATVEVAEKQQGDIRVELDPGYADNAEMDLGWTLEDPEDDALSGGWVRYPVTPGSMLVFGNGDTILLAPSEDRTPGNATHAFGTRRESLGVSEGKTTLTSPLFDVSGYANPYVSLDLWYSNDAFYWNPATDHLYMYLSNDDGESWTLLRALGRSTDDWEPFSYEIASFVQPGDRMRFRIVAADSGAQTWVFAAMDEFAVTDGPLTGVTEPGSEEVAVVSPLALFPNPLTGGGTLQIHIPERQSTARVELVDALGREVARLHHGALERGTTSLQLNSGTFAPGSYILQLIADDGSVASLPIMIVR